MPEPPPLHGCQSHRHCHRHRHCNCNCSCHQLPHPQALAKEGSKLGEKAEYARRVAMDLFRFLESFGTQQYGDKLLVPANALDRCVVVGVGVWNEGSAVQACGACALSGMAGCLLLPANISDG